MQIGLRDRRRPDRSRGEMSAKSGSMMTVAGGGRPSGSQNVEFGPVRIRPCRYSFPALLLPALIISSSPGCCARLLVLIDCYRSPNGSFVVQGTRFVDFGGVRARADRQDVEQLIGCFSPAVPAYFADLWSTTASTSIIVSSSAHMRDFPQSPMAESLQILRKTTVGT